VPGLTWELGAATDITAPGRRATHGGLGRYETHPFLVAAGAGVAPGTTTEARSSVIDLAPTILRHLGRPHDDLDGAPLNLG
jgi:arylsulfatase A-like enzyme